MNIDASVYGGTVIYVELEDVEPTIQEILAWVGRMRTQDFPAEALEVE